MGNFRPLPVKCWEAFLVFNGFKFDRINSSHHHWKKPGILRTVTFWGNEKQVPALHLKTCCRTIGCTIEYLMEWAEKNC